MPESKQGKKQESKKPTKVTKFFLQEEKPAIIFNKKGDKVLAQAKKGIFTALTTKIVSLLRIKGYKEVQ